MQIRVKLLFIACSGALLLTLTGCFKQKVIVKVNPDGSGEIAVSQIFSAAGVQALEQSMKAMKQQMAQMGSMGMDMPELDDIFYDEQSLKDAAMQFGPDVTFVKAKRYEKDGAKGAVALYAFEDISDVLLQASGPDTESIVAGMMDMGEDSEIEPPDPSECFTFAFQAGSPCVLTVHMPELGEALDPEDMDKEDEEWAELNEPLDPAEKQQLEMMGNPFGFTGDETKADMASKMFQDMSINVQLSVKGSIEKTNAMFQDAAKPNRIALVDLSFDRMFKEGGIGILSVFEGMDETLDVSSMRNLPGVRVETNRTVNISFTPPAK